MPKLPPIIRTSFPLGVKTLFDPSSVPPGALYEALNVRGDVSGILRIREGNKAINTSLGSGSIQGALSAFGKLLTVWNRNVYLFDEAGTQTLIGSALIGATASDEASIIRWTRSGAEMDYIFAGNGIFQTNGSTVSMVTPYTPETGEKTNLIRKSDGTLDTNTGPARCKFAVLKASLSQRLATAGDPQSPNTVYFSAPLDATYFPSDQIIQLPDDGGKITGLANWYSALIVFRDKDIWAFFGSSVTDTSATLILQDSSIGCITGSSIAVVPEVGIVFLGPDNVYALQSVTAIENQVKPIPIGDDVKKYITKALGYGTKGISAVYFDRKYRLSFPTCLGDQKIFIFSLLNGASWYMDSGPITNKYVVHNGFLYGSINNDSVWNLFDPTLLDDNGTLIPVNISYRREDLQPGPSRIKKIYIYVIQKGRSQTINLFSIGDTFNTGAIDVATRETAAINVGTQQHLSVKVSADGTQYEVDNFSIVVDVDAAASLSNVEPVRIYEARFSPSLKGNFLQIEITGTVPSEDIAILGYGIEYSNRGRIHGRKIITS